LSCKKLKAKPAIHFTGGDPLIRKDFFKLLEECKKRKILVTVLGNSYLITEKTALRLKKLGVARYQLSLDGLEKTHDYLRKKGSFKDAFRAYKILNKAGIKTICMFTLSKVNAKELIPVIHKIHGLIDIFGFARIVPEGNAKELKKQMLTPIEYKKLLLKVQKVYEKLDGKTKTKYSRKDHLFKLLEWEQGKRKINLKTKIVEDGCGAGITHLAILADGTILVCRRMPIILGNALKDNIADVFLNSTKLNEIRKIEKMEKCKKCELLRYCRGCPAVAYASTGNWNSPDPQCWKVI